jgi:hypothetical protein
MEKHVWHFSEFFWTLLLLYVYRELMYTRYIHSLFRKHPTWENRQAPNHLGVNSIYNFYHWKRVTTCPVGNHLEVVVYLQSPLLLLLPSPLLTASAPPADCWGGALATSSPHRTVFRCKPTTTPEHLIDSVGRRPPGNPKILSWGHRHHCQH